MNAIPSASVWTKTFAAITVGRIALAMFLEFALLSSQTQAAINVVDSLSSPTCGTNTSALSASVTVTPGANVLVVMLASKNGGTGFTDPTTLSWKGQTLNQAVTTINTTSQYRRVTIYYLYSPNPGTATITSTVNNTNFWELKSFTLGGVDTAVGPLIGSANSGGGTTNRLSFSVANCPNNGWAAVCAQWSSSNALPITFTGTGGTATTTSDYLDSGSTGSAVGMGYISGLTPAGSDTFQASNATRTNKCAFAAAVFAPLAAGPPVIAPTGQPQSTNVLQGAPATLTVTLSSGVIPLSYQWRKSGSNYGTATVSSALNNILAFASASTNDIGDYDVVVTNSLGSVISSVATLLVSVPPVVTLQPQAQTLCGPGTAVFSAQASGFPTPTVEWQVSTNSGVNWANISGATSTSYSFGAAPTDNGRRYRAVFTNAGGTATTAAAALVVNGLPIAVDATAAGAQNRTLIISIAGLLGLCTAPDGDAFYLSGVSPLSTNGAPVAITATNTICYQPSIGFAGADRFSYTITDILGCSATAEVGVTVNP